MKESKPRSNKTAKKKPGEENNDGKQTFSDHLNTAGIVSSGGYIFTFILLIVTLLIYDVTFMPQGTVDIEACKIDLLSNVHNQSDAVHVVLDGLSKIDNQEQNIQIINFIGSTGVGKTFIANILKRYFYSTFELNGPLHYEIQQNIVNKLKYVTFSYNLIILDDLKESDIDNLLTFLKEIPQDLVAFVICIFNIQETDNGLNHNINYKNADNIIQKFLESELPHKVAKFHEFDKHQARDWVVKQFIKKGINFNYHSHVIENVLSNQDIRFHGLKGLSSKINLEL